MLKSVHFLPKSVFFNTFLAFFLTYSSQLFAQSNNYKSYGAAFEFHESGEKEGVVYNDLKVSDSVNIQLTGTIKEVCQAKGCWMKVDVEGGDEVFVRFKDYGFFVPTDSAGKEVVLNGLAFVEEMTVEDQKHYALDKGASEEEIKKITQPKRTSRFEADGVLISN